MKLLREVALAWRMLWRDARAGEVGLLAVAIIIGVASLTTVESFVGRIEQALVRQSNILLGADLIISSDRPLNPEFKQIATAHGLSTTSAQRFPSMVVHGSDNVLAEVKAVADGYPLLGEVRIANELFGPERVAASVPAPGMVWVDSRLLTRLNLKVGDMVKVGQSRLRVVALMVQEPDSMGMFFNSLPRLIMNEVDVSATGLIQVGSRVRYVFYVAGEAGQIDAYRRWAREHASAWQNVESVREARPEIRSTLEHAGHFLGLTALVSVVIAAVAIALATRRFVARHLDGCAVMRCCGARQATIVRLYAIHFLLLGFTASVAGCVIGYIAQTVLSNQLAGVIAVILPPPSLSAAWHGLITGVVLLAGFALPPLVDMGRVSTLRVLRRDLGTPHGFGAMSYLLSLVAICGLVLWQAYDMRLGVYVLGGSLTVVLLAALLSRALIALLWQLPTVGGIGWHYGLANVRRRALGSVIQIIALGIGMMALLTLTQVRSDLLHSWQATLRPNMPNRFIINIQPDQVRSLSAFLSTHQILAPELFPMVRGRLVAINNRPVSPDSYASDRAKRLLDREFNLSWLQQPPANNHIVSGQWWSNLASRRDQLSVETSLAETLGLKLGDILTFDIAGNRLDAAITNLRKVDWDSFRVNFFVITPPALLQDYPATFITSFYVPARQVAILNQLVREFPNVVMIDVAQIIDQVQHMMDQVANAVQFVFLFSLAAGLAVLYAAIASTRDEREYEVAIMRVLGANRAQVMTVQLAEFALIGALAGLLATAGATALGYLLAHRVLHVPYLESMWIWLLGVTCGVLGVMACGWLGVRRILTSPPMQALRVA